MSSNCLTRRRSISRRRDIRSFGRSPYSNTGCSPMASSLVRVRPSRLPPIGEEFRFGIEEEYFVCCAKTLVPAMETPESLFAFGDGATLGREMLQAQLEVATQPHARL